MDPEHPLIKALTALGARWRYTHPTQAQFNEDQQLADGKELLELLAAHGVPWPMDEAMKVIPAPARNPLAAVLEDQGWTREPGSLVMHRPDKSSGAPTGLLPDTGGPW